MILITGILAFISGSYAILQVVRNPLMAIGLGYIYAGAIFSIDRYIVSGRGPRMAWFRLPLALLLGCVIAVPLELRLLEERIDKELAREYQSENKGAVERRSGQRDQAAGRIAELEKSISAYRSKIDEWGSVMEAEVVGRVKSGTTGRAGEGSAYRAAAAQKALNEELLRQVSSELAEARREQTAVLSQIDEEYRRSAVAQAHDLLSRYEAMHAIERQHPEALKMTWAITLVLVMIELFPALTKLTTPYTAYTALVEAREREDIQRAHSFANQNLNRLPASPHEPALFVIGQTVAVKRQQSETV